MLYSNAVSNVLNEMYTFDVLVTPLITLEPVKCEFKVIHPNSLIYAKKCFAIICFNTADSFIAIESEII